MQSPRADVFHAGVDGNGDVRERVDGAVCNFQRHALGLHQRDILLDQRCFRFGQDAAHVVAAQRFQFDPDRQASLQFRQQVGRLGDMECARGDEQDVVGLHRAVLGRDRRAFDQRQEIALHALARHVGAAAALTARNLVEFVEKHDAVLLHGLERLLHQCILIEQLVGFLGHERLVRLLHGEPTGFCLAAHLAENVADRNRAHLRAGHAGDLEHRESAARLLYLNFDFLVVHLAIAQLAPERLLGGGTGGRPGQRIDHALLSGELRLGLDVLALFLARLRDRDLDQVAHDLFDVAANIADLGELGRLDFEERGAGKPRKATRDLGLAHAGRADHQNVFRQDLFAQLLVELHAAPAVAQRDRNGALGVALADDEAVELGNDLAGREISHASRTIRSAGPSGVSTRRSFAKPAFS